MNSRSASTAVQSVVCGLLLVLTVSCTAPAPTTVVIDGTSDRAGFRAASPVPVPYVMPDQTLTDTSGRDYNLTTSPSKPVTLMFFGYTHCPTVCVGVLSDVAAALSRIPEGARDQIQLLFVTTDPARDNPQVIGHYLDDFDPAFIGLTGKLSTITSVAEQVGIDIQGVNQLPGGGYEVGHSTQVIGFDKQHRGVVLWTPSTPIGDLAADFQLLVAQQQ